MIAEKEREYVFSVFNKKFKYNKNFVFDTLSCDILQNFEGLLIGRFCLPFEMPGNFVEVFKNFRNLVFGI